MCGNSSELYSIVFIRWGKVCLSLFNIPIILEHLLDTFSECFFQFTCVSRVSPKKLNSSTFSRIVLQILGVSVFTFLLCMWNNINLVLAILCDSLFISSHSLILKSSSFIIYHLFGSMFGVLVRLLTVLKSVVSSAYDIKVKA